MSEELKRRGNRPGRKLPLPAQDGKEPEMDDVLNETNPVKVVVIALAIGALLFCTGCRVVRVKTPEWSASYWQFCQTTEAERLEVQAGENISLKIGKVKGEIDPKVKEAAAKAAALLMEAAK